MTYQSMKMRFGMLWNTGRGIDIALCVRVFLVALAFVAAHVVVFLQSENERLRAEASKLEAKLDLANHRIASCLNGGPVGFTREKGKNLWVSCGRAVEVEVEES